MGWFEKIFDSIETESDRYDRRIDMLRTLIRRRFKGVYQMQDQVEDLVSENEQLKFYVALLVEMLVEKKVLDAEDLSRLSASLLRTQAEEERTLSAGQELAKDVEMVLGEEYAEGRSEALGDLADAVMDQRIARGEGPVEIGDLKDLDLYEAAKQEIERERSVGRRDGKFSDDYDTDGPVSKGSGRYQF